MFFDETIFPSKIDRWSPSALFFSKVQPWSPSGRFLMEKFFCQKISDLMQFFALIPNMLFILLSNRSITIKTAAYEQHFNSFVTLCTNVVPTINPSKYFCLLKNISKDAEFHGLSEYIIISVITFVYSYNNLEK